MKEIISTEKAPPPSDPTPRRSRPETCCSFRGRSPWTPLPGEVVEATIQAQTAQSLTNLKGHPGPWRAGRWAMW